MNQGLTITFIIMANSANYAENFGNISTLKKLHRGDGSAYSYISRQALRYSLVKNIHWDNTPVDNEQKVVQFSPDTSIQDYPEIDFFGYMKTKAKKDAETRSAVCRISHAISLEPYQADLDFLTNMGLAKRSQLENAIAQSEIHQSLYAYTITLDLDLVGRDKVEDKEIEISKAEKIKRVKTLLTGFKLLYRDIKGRRENLSPIFAIGGIYDTKSPYFEGRIKVEKNKLNVEMLKNVMALDEDIQKNTKIGYMGGIFKNNEEIESMLSPLNIGDFFGQLEKKVEAYYEAH